MSAFIRVVPEEVEQHGPAAAIVLAHIRFRCASDGPGRIDREGYRWWRVPRAVIAEETGLTTRAVKHALQLLGDAVPAKEFPPKSDRSLAYRVAQKSKCPDQPEDIFVQPLEGGDQPEDIFVQPGDIYGQGLDKNDTMVGQIRPLHYLSEELKEGGEATGSRQAAAPPPSSPQSANGKPVYHPRCPVHIHSEHPPSCHRCKAVRQAAEERAVADQALTEDRRTTIRAAIKACTDCDDVGRLDDLSDCPKHPNFRKARAS